MLSQIKTYWNYGTHFCSIEVCSVSGKNHFYAVNTKKKKGEFVDFNFLESDSFEGLSKELPKNQHSHLIINTQKVLIKEIPFIENKEKALSQAFPSLSPIDFYYEIVKTKFKCFIALCRRDDVDELLKEAAAQKIEILGFQLGFSSFSKIIPLLKETNVLTSCFELTILNEEVDYFRVIKSEEKAKYQIDQTNVESNYLLALGGLFNYISLLNSTTSNFSDKNNGLFLQQKEFNFFRKGILLGIGILLFSLLINFFLFNTYYKNLQTTKEEFQILTSQKEDIQSKSLLIESKEKTVQNILNSGNSKSSYYINQIVAHKPSSILFNDMVFQPLQKRIRVDKQIKYDADKIIITGESNDKTAFSDWMETLENLNWVKSVTIDSFGFFKKNVSSFEITLLIKPNDSEK